MGSADWMPRNLDKRVEILFPVEDENLKAQVVEILDIQWRDNQKSHYMLADGSYEKNVAEYEPLCAQDYFRNQAVTIRKKKEETIQGRVFEPLTSISGTSGNEEIDEDK